MQWICREDGVRYELKTPVPARILLPGGEEKQVAPGSYTFWTEK